MSDAPSHPLLRLGAAPDDREAWAAAVEAYSALCWRIALRMLGDEQKAGDAVQDVLLALRASARRFRPGSDLDASAVAWVARVAVNTCHSHRRRRIAAGPPDAGLPAPAEGPVDAESLAALRVVVGELPVSLREAVELRYFANLDGARLAEALGVAQGAARMRVHRGLDALRTLLVKRGVCLSAVAVVGILDGVAEAAVPPPPPSVTSAWAQTPLPALATSTSVGVIVAMSTIAASIIGTVLAVALSATPPEPVPVPVPRPAPAPAPVRIAPFANVESAIAWLAAQQQPDGSWLPGRVVVPAADRGSATATALFALGGAGYSSTQPSRYQVAVKRSSAWLLAHPPAADAPLRDLALRVQCMCDIAVTLLPEGLWEQLAGDKAPSEDPEHRRVRETWDAATDAVLAQLLARRVGPGWPSAPGGQEIDTRTTAWAVAALYSARFAGRSAAQPALDQIRVWARRAWERHVGAGFPAQTTTEGAQVGEASMDIPGLMVVSLTHKSGDVPTWSKLIARAAADPPSQDAEIAWMWRMAAHWAEGAAWQSCHADRAAMHALAADQASAGRVDDAATAILAMQIHFGWERIFGAKGIDPIDPIEPPQTTY